MSDDTIDLEAARKAREADTTTPPPAATATVSELLEARGYIAIRTQALATCQAVGQLGIEPIEAAIAYIDRAVAKAKLAGATTDVLDGMDNELRAFKAVEHLWRQLRKNDEAAAARAALRAPGNNGAK